MTILKFAFVLALTVSAALAQLLPPQGRLTLQSNTPVMTQDSVGVGTVYYTPYVGNSLPLPNGSGGYTNSTFSQLTLSFNSSFTLDANIYDIFAYNNAGSWALCTGGPAWASSTSRGSGAGTTQITQVGGIWVNAEAMTCYIVVGGYSVAADMGVYLGSVYMTSTGQTTMSLHPAAVGNGTNNVLGLYNAYNRVRVTAYERDSTSNWTYGTASWRAADNSAANDIRFLDGLQQSPVTGNYSVLVTTAPDTVGGYIGLNIDSSTTTPDIAAGASSAAGQTSSSQSAVTETFYPVLGLHYIQAVEYASGSTTQIFGVNSSQQVMALTVTLDM
jgi:hypothetical protein